MLKFTHLSDDLSLESLGEGREKALKKKKAVILVLQSLYSPLFPPSFFVCHSLRSATLSIPPIFFNLADFVLFFYLVTFVLSIMYNPSEKAFKRQSDHRKQLKHNGNMMHNTKDLFQIWFHNCQIRLQP